MHIYWLVALAIIGLINGLNFFIAKTKNDVRWLDILWPLNFLGVGILLLIIHRLTMSQSFPAQHFVVIFLSIWALRQVRYLFRRQKRFTLSTRHDQDNKMPSNLLSIYIKETLLAYALSIMLIIVLAYPIETTFLRNIGLFIGSVIVVLGFLIEMVADQQLRNFKYRLEMEGRVLKTGLFQYTRHPNYFGETLMWIGLFVIVVTNSEPIIQFVSIISPIVMITYSLTSQRIYNNENHLSNNEEYQAYKNKTNRFFPWI